MRLISFPFSSVFKFSPRGTAAFWLIIGEDDDDDDGAAASGVCDDLEINSTGQCILLLANSSLLCHATQSARRKKTKNILGLARQVSSISFSSAAAGVGSQ